MRKINKLTACLLAMVFMVGLLVPAYAGQLDDKRQELNQVEREIQKQRSKINQARKKEKDISKDLAILDRGMETTRGEINRLESQVKAVEGDIRLTEKDIQRAEKELAEQTEYLSERLVTVYEDGEISYLEVLFSSADIADFLTRYDLLREIVQQDIELIAAIEKERNQLDEIKQGLQVKKSRLISTQEAKKSQENYLGEQADQKNKALKAIKNDRQAYEKALRELEQTSKELERIIRSMQKPDSAYQGTGVFCWPAPSSRRITSDYGMRYHPILKKHKLHTGMDIGAGKGSKVVAADGGTVLKTGGMGGYGNTIIIDHGGGISTLYAHLSKISVSPGQKVERGGKIGEVGSTGWSTGPHLHFEVRESGNPVNPNKYIK
ncbi:MAG: peptidoglycan DD-metalloendopeptidase family protein [Syntrophomonadaceae bacterium]|jgi:murein DD-endopeptidase MepM/ murein hydrolase activator NlpD|nr:peptidoglycan DD-metalloendopeptidase family protein [Syntrophomonadaceae bacterium]